MNTSARQPRMNKWEGQVGMSDLHSLDPTDIRQRPEYYRRKMLQEAQ